MSAHRPHRQAVKRAVIAYAERLDEDGYSHEKCIGAAIDAAYPAIVAERNALAAKVARVEALVESRADVAIVQGETGIRRFADLPISVDELRAALTANDTGVTLTPANAAQGNLAAPSTIPDDGDDA